MSELNSLPGDLPVPGDDGAADHLSGSALPAITVVVTSGEMVRLDRLDAGRPSELAINRASSASRPTQPIRR